MFLSGNKIKLLFIALFIIGKKVNWKYVATKPLLLMFNELTLRENCPNTEFFLVRIQENTDQKKVCIWTLFKQCHCIKTEDGSELV